MTERRVIVFRTRLRDGIKAQYDRHAEDVYQRAIGMTGYVSIKDFTADDGERCAVIEWDSADNLAVWRDDAFHREAQAAGRERYYEQYSLQVCSELRSSRFDAATKTWTKSDRDPARVRAAAQRWLGDERARTITADQERAVIELENRVVILEVRDGEVVASREFGRPT